MPETIGQQLQSARQARGLTLEEAARTTCIRARYLQGLETDDRSAFPSPVQGKGFLRNYAAFLGLPVQPLLDQWDGKNPPPVPPAVTAPPTPEPVSGPGPIEAEAEAEPTEESQPQPAADRTQPPMPAAEPSLFPTGSQLIFKEIGQTLREQRELLSLSLTEIEKYTHVRTHYLKALEAGKMDELPSMVQGRGMLNNYSRFLNLDANQVMNRFADALQARREELNLIVPVRHPPVKVVAHPTLKRFLSMDLIFGGGMVLVLVLFVIWGAAQVMDAVSKDNDLAQTAPPVSEVLINATMETGTSATSEALGTDVPVEGTAPVATDLASAETTPEAQETTTGEAGSPPPAVSGKVQVYIVALQRVWMKVSVDGKDEFTGRAVAGNAYTFEGDEKVELVTGDASALQVYYNDENLGTLGNVSEVVNLIFTIDQGVLGPTPTITATPTNTPRVTATPTPTGTSQPPLNNTPTTTAP